MDACKRASRVESPIPAQPVADETLRERKEGRKEGGAWYFTGLEKQKDKRIREEDGLVGWGGEERGMVTTGSMVYSWRLPRTERVRVG